MSVMESPSGSDEPLLIDAEAAEQTPGFVGTVTFWHAAIGGEAVLTFVVAWAWVFAGSILSALSCAML